MPSSRKAPDKEVLPPIPHSTEQQRILSVILRSLRSNDEGETETRKLLSFLFQRSMAAAPKGMEPVPAADVARELGVTVKSLSESRSRLNRKLPHLLKEDRYQIQITTHPWTLEFSLVRNGDLEAVRDFWMPYRKAGAAQILYPEPQFFKDRRDTYFRNHAYNENSSEALKFLKKHKPLGYVEPSHSFVPSGYVVALVELLEKLPSLKIAATAERLRWSGDLSRDKSLVLLGSSSNVAAVSRMSQPLPIRTDRDDSGRGSVWVRGRKRPYTDTHHQPNSSHGKRLSKWVVVTRGLRDDRTVTTVSGHSRGVAAVVRLLTRGHAGKLSLETVAQALDSRTLSGQFQLLFSVSMTWSEGELDVEEIALVRSFQI